MKAILLTPGAKLPTRANNNAAGFDLYAPKDFIVNPGRNVLPLGIAIELIPGTEGQIRPRSGFSAKGMEGHDCHTPQDGQHFDADVILGTVDPDYRGEVGVIIKSCEKKPFIIKKGTKVAQMVVQQFISYPFIEASRLSETERAQNGFGSTGTK